jgi:uncharacterized protein (DUF362 family)
MAMTTPHHKVGHSTLAKVTKSAELRSLLKESLPESETIIIKPNWVSQDLAAFTDAHCLSMILESLDSKVIVTESHMIARAPRFTEDGGMPFTVDGKDANWRWLAAGEGWKWLIENPDLEWFRNGGHWDAIKEEDKTFLDEQGFSDLFNEFDVEYLNVTDEVWSGRTAEPSEVKQLVESRYGSLEVEEIYHIIPKRFLDLRGSTFISLARVKLYATFTLKNMFGMLPEPARSWWHGKGESRFIDSFIGINKVYHSLFNMFGICEAFTSLSVPDDNGDYDMIMPPMRFNVLEGQGFVAFGKDLVELDTILLGLTKPYILQDEKSNVEPIIRAQQVFGRVDDELVRSAKQEAVDWITSSSRVKP